jgi:hypothetical protein
MSNISCLRNLPIDHLDISNTSAWQDWVLLEMPLTELNIKKTSFKNLTEILKMKSLKTLRIAKNKFLKAKPPKKSELVILRESP